MISKSVKITSVLLMSLIFLVGCSQGENNEKYNKKTVENILRKSFSMKNACYDWHKIKKWLPLVKSGWIIITVQRIRLRNKRCLLNTSCIPTFQCGRGFSPWKFPPV